MSRAMLRRGTTPTHIFNTSMSLVGCEACYITYKQRGVAVLEKALDDITITDEKITVTLSQQETLSFWDDVPVEMQIRARFTDEQAVASNIVMAPVGRILKEGVV